MANMTNQTDMNTKTEVDDQVVALNTAEGLRALQTDLITNKASLDARATDNLANVNTTLTTPNPYASFGALVFPVDIPAFWKQSGSFTRRRSPEQMPSSSKLTRPIR